MTKLKYLIIEQTSQVSFANYLSKVVTFSLHQSAVEHFKLLFCSYFMKTPTVSYVCLLPLFIISFAKHEFKFILNDCIVRFINEKHRNRISLMTFMYRLK